MTAALLAIALCLNAEIANYGVNNDGIRSLRAADAFLVGDVSAAFKIERWPFYSAAIAAVAKVSGLELPSVVKIFPFAALAGIAYLFVRIVTMFNADLRVQYLAVAFISTLPALNTWRDGWRILMTMVRLFKDHKPLAFFGIWALLLSVLSVWLALPLVGEFRETGLVPRYPTAILCTGLMLSALLSLVCGLILDSVSWQRLEAKRIAWLGAGK